MKSGTPGFISKRLRQAREARGLTATSFAEMLGITRAAISLYETGNASPNPEVMQKICDILNLPISFFLKPLRDYEPTTIFYRSMNSATRIARSRAESWYKWLNMDIMPYIREYVSLPAPNVPMVTVKDIHAISDEDIEKAASEVRRYWGLGNGPISNVMLLLENNGMVVSRIELSCATLDAFSTWCPQDNTPYIILNADKKSSVRSRFDLSHELAHLVLHRNLDSKRLNNTTDFKMVETQAHRFASAFLLPSVSFVKDFCVPTLDALRTLKSKWMVSVAMQIRRAQDLQLISEDHARRMWINYNRRGWRHSEPLDESLPIEEPRLLKRALEVITSNKVRMPEQILSEICLSSSIIETIGNLKPRYFGASLPFIDLKDNIKTSAEQNEPKKENFIDQQIEDILRNYEDRN